MGSRKKVGLHLGLCIKDVITGIVDERHIQKIITETCVFNEAWDDQLETYSLGYWKDDPKGAKEVFYRFLKADKIEQPRTEGKLCPNIKGGHWS